MPTSTDYARILPSFWTGRTGRTIAKMGADEQVVALYILTCPTRSPLGLFYLPVETIAHDTGRGFEGASKALRRVCEAGLCSYDDAEEVVWVPEMAGIQIAPALSRDDNRVKWIRSQVATLRKLPFFLELRKRWGTQLHFSDVEPLRSPLQAPSKPLPEPREAIPSHPIPSQPTHTQHTYDREVQPVEERTPPMPPPAPARRLPAKTDADLRPLFDAYCRGTGHKLTWGHRYMMAAEQMHAAGFAPADIEQAARYYRAKLTDAVPSITRFAAEVDRWHAARQAGDTPAAAKPDKPGLGAPSPAARQLWCSACMATHRGLCPKTNGGLVANA